MCHWKQGGNRGIALLILYFSTKWSGWSTPCCGHLTPGESGCTHCRGGRIGPMASLDRHGTKKISLPHGFKHGTIQHLASNYTDYAIQAPLYM